MDILLLVLAVYLSTGIIAITLLSLLTERIWDRIRVASLDTRQLTGESPKVALVVTIFALWVLWPFAVYAAVRR